MRAPAKDRMDNAAPLTFHAGWRRAAPALALVLAVILFAYRDTTSAMVEIWSRSDTFAHAFLVPPIVAWLIWRRRKALALLQPRPCPWLLAPMAALAFGWLLGDLIAANAATQIAMTGLLVLAVPVVLGVRVAGAIAFPLAFAFFAVPIGEFLLPQLMSWTADFMIVALRATGIPVFREGQQFVIPSGRWAVVEACSGIRYLIASFMVGTLFAYLHYRSIQRRLAFIAISIAVPIVANWVRAYLIVLLGHLSGNKVAVGVDHLVYGWLFFGLVIGLMFAIGMLWSEADDVGSKGPTRAVPPATGAVRHPIGSTWATAAVASIVALLPHVAPGAYDEAVDGAPIRLASFGEMSGWHAATSPKETWKPHYRNPSAESEAVYTMQDRAVGMYIGYYRLQGYDRKLVSSVNELVGSDNPLWVQTGATTSETLAVGDDTELVVRSLTFRSESNAAIQEQRFRAWQFYWVGDKLTSSDLRAKLYGAADRLLGRADDAAVIVIYASDEPEGSARTVLKSFSRANLGAIIAGLRATRDNARTNAVAGVQRAQIRRVRE